MNHEQLDYKLKALTKKELANKNRKQLSAWYQNLDKKIMEGQEVYVFPDLLVSEDSINILKHDRFAEVPLHIHTFIEFTYVYSGQCTQTINGHHLKLTEGQVCIIDTDVPHSISSTTEDDILINVLMRKEYFSSSFLGRLSNNGLITDFIINAISTKKDHDQYIIFHSETNENMHLLFKQLLCEYYDKNLCSKEMIDCYMLLIFSELIRIFQYDTNKTDRQSKMKTNLINVLRYIEKNYENCSLVSTAKAFNYNPNYLSTMIKNGTGKSFKEIVQIQKLTHASFLLTNTQDPIYEIALQTGQSNLSYFYKKFKDYFGKTPQEFREQ